MVVFKSIGRALAPRLAPDPRRASYIRFYGARETRQPRDERRQEAGTWRPEVRRALLANGVAGFFNLNFRRALEATPELIWRYRHLSAISPVFVAVSRRPPRACYAAAPALPRPGGPYRRLCKQVLLWSKALLSTQRKQTTGRLGPKADGRQRGGYLQRRSGVYLLMRSEPGAF